MTTYTLILQTIGSLTGVATSTSLIIAYRHLRLVNRNSQISFEDALSREFRQVANRIPLRALLGEALDDAELAEAMTSFYWYFDLTNEQVFQRRHGRVSAVTWRSWSEGIERTMRRPAFARAWSELDVGAVGVFNDLRRLAEHGFTVDPIEWRPRNHPLNRPRKRPASARRCASRAARAERRSRPRLPRLRRSAAGKRHSGAGADASSACRDRRDPRRCVG